MPQGNGKESVAENGDGRMEIGVAGDRREAPAGAEFRAGSPARKGGEQEMSLAQNETGTFGRSRDMVGNRKRRVFVAEHQESVPVHRKIAVHKAVPPVLVPRMKREIEPRGTHQTGEIPIVISRDQDDLGPMAQLPEHIGQQGLDRGERHGPVDDVAQQNDLSRIVSIYQPGEAFPRFVARGNRQEMSGMPVSPFVTEMKIGDGEKGGRFEKDRARGVQPEAGPDLKPRMIHPVPSTRR